MSQMDGAHPLPALRCRPQAALFFDPAGRPGPRRRLRRRGTFFACAAFSATAFGGRTGPPGRHFPRRFRRRCVFAFGLPVPSKASIALRTSACTNSRITVRMLFCLGISPPLSRDAPTRKRAKRQRGSATGRRSSAAGRQWGAAPSRSVPELVYRRGLHASVTEMPASLWPGHSCDYSHGSSIRAVSPGGR